jgi:hypothetical protein
MEHKSGPKDVFMHLLSIIALYVSVGISMALLFQYINIWIPDPLERVNYYSVSSLYDSIRWFISVLIIVFPVYAWTVWYLNRDYAKFPEKREMKLRRWLLYLTLFLAALIIIGDLIALVYNLLRGEFTSRFILKVLTVFVIAGAVFTYYLWEVRRKISQSKPLYIKGIVYGSIVAIAAAIIGGFFIVGSPAEERAYRFDEERLQDLQSIQSQIVYYWQSKQNLPGQLSQLEDNISGYRVPTDPETGASYE